MVEHEYRNPVQTYEQAIYWLIEYTDPTSWVYDVNERFPTVASFVCDCFWVTPHQLREKLKKELNAMGL